MLLLLVACLLCVVSLVGCAMRLFCCLLLWLLLLLLLFLVLSLLMIVVVKLYVGCVGLNETWNFHCTASCMTRGEQYRWLWCNLQC